MAEVVVGGCPAPWQAPAANGRALEEARAASGASKTCEEGRGCRRSLSSCLGSQRVLGATATAAHREPACPLLTSTGALPMACLLRSRTR